MQAPGKQPPSEARVAHEVERLLADRIPSGWALRVQREAPLGRFHVDLLAEIMSPAGETAVFAFEIKRRLESRDILRAAAQARKIATERSGRAVPAVAAPYLSPRTRALLQEHCVSYVDATGNVRIAASIPGLFVSADGTDRDPWPRNYKLQTLKGRGAARAVRAIVDTRPPYGVRELAQLTGASAPTLSRVLEMLDREAIVTRRRGAVVSVDWKAALRRWTEDYDQTGSHMSLGALEPRGLRALEQKLRAATFEYAATGAFAAQRFDPVAPARQAAVYVTDAAKTLDRLDLREVEAGGNIVLLEPLDLVVFDRTVDRDDLRCAAPSQLAADLLTGPGREPSEGEQMLQWMEKNEDVWRS